jgi:hypothetical protein
MPGALPQTVVGIVSKPYTKKYIVKILLLVIAQVTYERKMLRGVMIKAPTNTFGMRRVNAGAT